MITSSCCIIFSLFFVATCGDTTVTTPTNWNAISTFLSPNWGQYLPPIPSSKISVAWTEDTNVPFTWVTLDDEAVQDACGTSISSPSYPSQAILLGTIHNGNESCRAVVKAPYNYIEMHNRHRTDLTASPVTAQPTWVQARWPISDQGVPSQIDVKLDTRYPLRTYGGNPCNGTLTNSSYICRLNVAGVWDYNMQPGFHMLWTTPGSAGHIITGPYLNRTFTVDVPASLRNTNTRELIVTIFIFNQYSETVECPATGSCRTNAIPTSVVSLSLITRSVYSANFPKVPPTAHPRLFGNNTEWEDGNKKMDAIPCRDAKAPWGGLTDIRHQWEVALYTGSTCANTRKPGLGNHTIAVKYFNPTYGQVDDEEAMRIFYLIRRVRYCHSVLPASSCPYPLADINQLATLVIQREFTYWSTWSWWNQGLIYDLGTQDPMRFWCLYMDTFWSEVNSTIRSTIEARFSIEINKFIEEFDTRHWALYNGNNWTPYLALPAVTWAVTYYYEDSRAQDVIHRAVDIMYLNRKMWKDDGAYVEGVAQYSFMSLDSIVEMNRILIPAMGKASEAMVDHRIASLPQWHVDSMASDGLAVDFGDSHSVTGWGGLTTLNAHIWRELLGYETVTPTPCIARPYWMNKYYGNGFTNPWLIPYQTATKNWTAITSQVCTTDTQVQVGAANVALYPSVQYCSFRTYLKTPSLTSLAKSEQNFQVFYAFQAKDNSFPHSELDYGTFLWTAYGSRLIADLGYGRVSSTNDRQGYLDGNPKGHNTIFVEEANGPADNNTSQFNFVAGTMTQVKVSGFDAFVLDGSAVYGRDRTDGWLQSFIRTGISLPGGYAIITDFFRTKDARGPLTVHNNFYGLWSNATGGCKGNVNATFTLLSDNQFSIRPDCNVDKSTSVSLGFIYGVSLNNNARFIYDGPITFPTQYSADTKHRTRFAAQAPIASDLRVFALGAVNRTQTTTLTLTIASDNTDTNHPFFLVTVGATKYRVEFTRATSADPLTIACISNSTSAGTPPSCLPNVVPRSTSESATTEAGSATTGGSAPSTGAASTSSQVDEGASPGHSLSINIMLALISMVVLFQ